MHHFITEHLRCLFNCMYTLPQTRKPLYPHQIRNQAFIKLIIARNNCTLVAIVKAANHQIADTFFIMRIIGHTAVCIQYMHDIHTDPFQTVLMYPAFFYIDKIIGIRHKQAADQTSFLHGTGQLKLIPVTEYILTRLYTGNLSGIDLRIFYQRLLQQILLVFQLCRITGNHQWTGTAGILNKTFRTDAVLTALNHPQQLRCRIALLFIHNADFHFLTDQCLWYKYRHAVDIPDSFPVDPCFLYSYFHIILPLPSLKTAAYSLRQLTAQNKKLLIF